MTTPTFGDIIVIHSKPFGVPASVPCGVPIRLGRTRRRGDFRYTALGSGKSVDWFARSLQHCDWSFAA